MLRHIYPHWLTPCPNLTGEPIYTQSWKTYQKKKNFTQSWKNCSLDFHFSSIALSCVTSSLIDPI